MMFFAAPFARRTATSLLTLAITAMVCTGALAYIVRTVKYAGRAEAEMRQLTRINKENLKANKRQSAAIAALERAKTQAEKRVAAVRNLAEQEQRTIDEIEAAGEGATCPIDCRLP